MGQRNYYHSYTRQLNETTPFEPPILDRVSDWYNREAAEPVKDEVQVTDTGWDELDRLFSTFKNSTTGGKTTDTKTNISVEGVSNSINQLLKLFNKYGIQIKVTSGKRPGAKTASGKISHHATGSAVDIIPIDGDFIKLAQIIKNTPEIKQFMIQNGLGVLDETTPEMLAKTGGTGAHFHIGPDRIAQTFWQS